MEQELSENTGLFDRCRVGATPSIYYLPDYVTAAEEQRLLSEAQATKAKWVEVREREILGRKGASSSHT